MDKNKKSINIENIYKNDYKLIKIIEKTKGIRNNNQSLTKKKNNLKDLMTKINDDYEINDDQFRKNLHLSNKNFHNEYNLFKKGKNKKEAKIIFKDLVKLYRARGYKIPNFSINEHNIFKINPLLESKATTMSNCLLSNQILKKNDDSEKIINYLKKIGILLSEKLTNDNIKNLKKIKISRLKYINEDDSIEELKKKIEILEHLINTNALSKLDEPKKARYKSVSRQNSYKSNKYFSNKNLYLKQRYSISRKNSRNSRKSTIIKLNIINNNKKGIKMDKRISIESSVTNTSIISNYINNKKKDSSENMYKIFNTAQGIKTSKTPKDVKIPALNLNKLYFNKESEEQNKNNKIQFTYGSIKNRYKSEKVNNLLKTPIRNKNIYLTRKSNKDFNSNFLNPYIRYNNGHLSALRNNSNDSFSTDELYDTKYHTSIKKNSVDRYPYTNRNEFINFAYYKFTKKGFNNCEEYIKNYLNKVKGYNDDKTENFLKNIYDKNIKNNIKELENQITENDIYCKTERLYLNNHLIKRIKSTLKNMDEKDKIILKLEKNFADAIINK